MKPVSTLILAGLLLQDPAEIDRLLWVLREGSLEERDVAQHRLIEMGPSIIAALRKELPDADAETRLRIEVVLLELERPERERAHDAAQRAGAQAAGTRRSFEVQGPELAAP